MAKSRYTLKQKNIFIFGMILLLAITIILGLRIIADGLFGVIIIYVIFRPLNIYFQEKKYYRKWISSALLLLISFICLVLPVLGFTLLIIDQITHYINNPEEVTAIYENIDEFASDRFNQPDMVENGLASLKAGAGTVINSIINGAVHTFIQLVVMYFTLYFIFKDFRSFESALIKYLPFKPATSERLGNEIKNMTYSNILGQSLIAVIQGTILGLGFLIFGINNPLFWGAVATFASMIPLFGSPFVFMPAGIIELSNGNNFEGIGIILYGYLIVSTVDNFIRMAIGRKVANTHPLITVIGVVIGLPLFGIMGILYGPLIIALFFILVDVFEKNRTVIAKTDGTPVAEQKT